MEDNSQCNYQPSTSTSTSTSASASPGAAFADARLPKVACQAAGVRHHRHRQATTYHIGQPDHSIGLPQIQTKQQQQQHQQQQQQQQQQSHRQRHIPANQPNCSPHLGQHISATCSPLQPAPSFAAQLSASMSKYQHSPRAYLDENSHQSHASQVRLFASQQAPHFPPSSNMNRAKPASAQSGSRQPDPSQPPAPVAKIKLADEHDSHDGDSARKKKYLTAKYGQQQMSLIKKRLKIEMWLHEQLQELAKSCSDCQDEDELDEIDVDLDQLLDLEDDLERRRWLRKTLAPLVDQIEAKKMDSFLDEVLEKSRLL